MRILGGSLVLTCGTSIFLLPLLSSGQIISVILLIVGIVFVLASKKENEERLSLKTSTPAQGHQNAQQALIYWANAAENNGEWMKWEWRNRGGNGNWNMSVQEPNFNNADIEYRRIEPVLENLDQRMKASGMMPVSEMLERSSLGRFSAHVGVTDLESFEGWIQKRREEFIRMQAGMTLDGQERDELFEWVVAYNAVLGEVIANFRQATGRKP